LFSIAEVNLFQILKLLKLNQQTQGLRTGRRKIGIPTPFTFRLAESKRNESIDISGINSTSGWRSNFKHKFWLLRKGEK
jgi:hypothetical protein